MANSTLDDVLSMIDTDGGSQPQQKSSQASLRDRMLQESNNNKPKESDTSQLEQTMNEEIINEEVEAENKRPVNMKVVVVVGIAAVIILIVAVFALFSSTSKNKEADEEVTEEPVDTQPIDLTPVEEDPDLQPIESLYAVTYTDEQKLQLSALGATEEQIEQWQSSGTLFEYPYYTLQESYAAAQLEATLPTYDMTSAEYKEVISDTWLSLEHRTDIAEWSTEDYLAMSYEVTQNLDYEKVEPYGNQLFLKVYLDAQSHDNWFFLCISPQDWNKLDDSGNVVVNYTYSTHYKPYENRLDAVEDTDHIFITAASLDIIQSLRNMQKGEQ